MKKLLAIILATLLMSPAYANEAIQLQINREPFVTNVEPILKDNRVFVPMRDIFEYFDMEVLWGGENQTVQANKEGLNIQLQINSNILIKNNEPIEIDVSPILENERTLVPLRAVAESIGAKVSWNGETGTVSISYDNFQDKKIIPVTIEMENGGVMKLELYRDTAPVTVTNFITLCNEGFYDGLVFHRVIEGFMIQGGGYGAEFTPKNTEAIKGEFSANGVENDLKHTRGVISMARTNVPDSASSQFFIMHEDAPHLDGQYAAFGMLTDGFDVLDEIASAETVVLGFMENVPASLPVIKSIRVEE